MAQIIESTTSERRLIKMSTNDIISIVQSYQQAVPRGIMYEEVRNYLDDIVIYIPEDI